MTINPFGWLRPRGGFLLSLLLALAAGFLVFPKLRGYADPTGLNGYFYLKQTKTLATLHSFYFSDHSLAFAPLVFLRWLTGSELLAFQIGICLALGLAFAGVLALVEAVPFSRWERWAARAVLLLALFSSSFFSEFSLSFYKNSVAMGLVLVTVNFLLRRRFWGAAGFFLLAFLTHKSVALLGLIFALVYFAEQGWAMARRRGVSRAELKILAVAIASCAVLAILFLYHFPKATAFVNFAVRNFQGPSARVQWFFALLSNKPPRAFEISAWSILLGIGLYSWRGLNREWRLSLATVMIFALVALHPFQPPGPATLGYRLCLMMPLLAPLLALSSSFLKERYLRFAGLAVLVAGSALHLSPLGFREQPVRREVRPYSVMLPHVMELKKYVAQEDHLVSHHGLEFFVDYTTDIRSRSFLAAPDFTGKKFRVAFVPEKSLRSDLDRDELVQERILDLGGGYALFTEEDWESFLARHAVPYSWKNAIGERPAHVYE